MNTEQMMTCIRECLECMKKCNQCYDACLQEEEVNPMSACIRLTRDCADVCVLVAQFMTRNSEHMKEACVLCEDICNRCAEECRNHAYEHCQACAAACEACAKKCRAMAAA
ncbi:four-helix bundle copper-binding protein [Paenibacillus dendritiformis]|uniref:four-helix bundle copper-binding protein n=1 Tax=Paenibacillus dendritiformis TaxID=130049 RepID=UPI00248C8DF1|nr:four-helix bundle copper-binding protein [Paenibacillus dendritiformis]WGU96706.1 four-helix bundle copper-binding protein [Paenibacillus dendritiformis]